jgi:hypothetical protein
MLGGSLYKPFGNFNCLRSSLYQLLLTKLLHFELTNVIYEYLWKEGVYI